MIAAGWRARTLVLVNPRQVLRPRVYDVRRTVVNKELTTTTATTRATTSVHSGRSNALCTAP